VQYTGLQALGQEYNKFADTGEAYTLAAAVTLGVPAMSNDKTALDALEYNGKALPSPVLRVFDLLAFSFQTSALEEKDCDKVRKELVQIHEHVPGAFRHASFIDGLGSFCPRILDAGVKTVGTSPAAGPAYSARVLVAKK
jgi:hypothetical protein